MYTRVNAKTFRQLADALAERTNASVKIFCGDPSWGSTVAKNIQGILIRDALAAGSSPMSASYDGYEETDEPNWYIFKYSLADIQNKALIHHAKLTRFKEDEV